MPEKPETKWTDVPVVLPPRIVDWIKGQLIAQNRYKDTNFPKLRQREFIVFHYNTGYGSKESAGYVAVKTANAFDIAVRDYSNVFLGGIKAYRVESVELLGFFPQNYSKS